MLEFMHFGKKQTYVVKAEAQNHDEVLAYVATQLQAKKVTQTQINKALLAVGEIFANVASYAYDKTGDLRIEISAKNKMVYIQFIDAGYAYNPLEKDMPDVTLGAAARQIGGLGIYITRKVVDFIDYERRDGLNVLTIGIKKEK